MKYEEFKKVLKKNNLTIKKFSELANISYATCNTWSNRGAVSAWVESWLNLYMQIQNLKENNNNVLNEEYQELLQLKESLQAVMGGIKAS
jgi:predicted transcriptional regulator